MQRTIGLPNGRALVGGLLIAVAVVVTVLAYRGASAEPTARFVVASTDLAPGSVMTEADLRTVSLSLDGSETEGLFGSTAELEGAVTLAPLSEGQLIYHSAVATSGDGSTAESGIGSRSQEFSLSVPRSRAVSGSLRPGERIDVLATYGSDADATTYSVVRDADVVAVGDSGSSTLGDSADVTITLRLTSRADVLAVAHAQDVAEVTIVRATMSQDLEQGPDAYNGPSTAGTDVIGAQPSEAVTGDQVDSQPAPTDDTQSGDGS